MARGRVDPAPMVDVVFLLLIFLILNSPFVLQPGATVTLPTLEKAPSASFQGLVVTVTQTNLVFFNNQAVRLEDLPQLLATTIATSRSKELVIKADIQVPHGTIVQIMGMAFESGITAVNLATRPTVPVTSLPR